MPCQTGFLCPESVKKAEFMDDMFKKQQPPRNT